MGVLVSRATSVDVDDLSNLRWRWRTEGQSSTAGDKDEFQRQFATWTEQCATHVACIARDGERAVGMGYLAIFDRVPNPGAFDRRQGDVQSLYVEPEYRDRGVGAMLVEALLALAREEGCFRVTVYASERAVTLYEREGFAHVQQLLLRRVAD